MFCYVCGSKIEPVDDSSKLEELKYTDSNEPQMYSDQKMSFGEGLRQATISKEKISKERVDAEKRRETIISEMIERHVDSLFYTLESQARMCAQHGERELKYEHKTGHDVAWNYQLKIGNYELFGDDIKKYWERIQVGIKTRLLNADLAYVDVTDVKVIRRDSIIDNYLKGPEGYKFNITIRW